MASGFFAGLFLCHVYRWRNPYGSVSSNCWVLFLLFLIQASATSAKSAPKIDTTLRSATAEQAAKVTGFHIHHASRSSKRGLVAISADAEYTAQDLDHFIRPHSDLTWYYNYGAEPTESLSSSFLEFVPMLWGPPGDGFRSYIVSQLHLGANISHILSFNEPDACEGGGSCVSPTLGAKIWRQQLNPLKQLYPSIKLGSPAVTGSPRGLRWLYDFFAACAGDCHADFTALHWYGDSVGFEGWINQMSSLHSLHLPSELWITEFAFPFVNLPTSQRFYNTSISFLDSTQNVARYSYFGAFRSSDSNIGPDAAMLDQRGRLTDIGSWYLGGMETGNVPRAHAKGVASSTHFNCIIFALALAFWLALIYGPS